MKTIKLGGLVDVSAVSMGCMRMCKADKNDVARIIETATQCGITHFDHADIYGAGESEERFGKYIKENPSFRDGIVLQSKCGIRKGFYDFSKEHIISSVEGSLKRLNTDHLDILVLHRPDTLMEPEVVAEAFDELQSSGKVKHFGVSNHNAYQIELLKTAVEQPILTNQLQFSIMESGMVTSGLNVNMKNDESVMHDGGLLEYSRIKNITIQTWSPFQAGFIKEPFIGNDSYKDLNDELNRLAEQYDTTPTTIAGAWILRHPARMQLISGSMNVDRIRQIASATDVELTRQEWYSLYLKAGYRLP